jgi:hypothetical protein
VTALPGRGKGAAFSFHACMWVLPLLMLLQWFLKSPPILLLSWTHWCVCGVLFQCTWSGLVCSVWHAHACDVQHDVMHMAVALA